MTGAMSMREDARSLSHVRCSDRFEGPNPLPWRWLRHWTLSCAWPAVRSPLELRPAPPPEIVLDGKTVPTTRFKSELRPLEPRDFWTRFDVLKHI